MKRHALTFVLLSATILAAGCKENFSPKTEFKDTPVLQCIIPGVAGRPPMTEIALLTRTYNVDGFDPSVNSTDPSIAGASMSMVVNGTAYPMRDSLRFNRDSLRYGSRQLYYFGSMKAPAPRDPISISVRLPDGRVLSAQTVVPSGRQISSSINFPNGVTTRTTFLPGVKSWTISWESNEAAEPHLFFPSLAIWYSKAVKDYDSLATMPVPMRYVGSTPIYPSYTTATSCEFEFAALDSAMAMIAAGDPDKSKYGVHTAWFSLIEYDAPLSKYYASVNGSLDQFSIRTDQTVYSNIGGGIGIFGSYFTDTAQFDVDIRYVLIFGYRYR